MDTTLQPADSAAAELDTILHSAAIAPLDDIGWIRVTGSDRVRWLNGMVTNNVAVLKPGQGCYNFVLNAQGRIQGDLTAWMLEDSIMLETDRDQIPGLLAHLDHFIIMDDVEVTEVAEDRAGILLAGPEAKLVLEQIGLAAGQISILGHRSAIWNKNQLDIVRTHSPIVPRFEIWSGLTTILQIQEALIGARAASVLTDTLEQLRILSGTPRYGVDIRNTATAHDLPQETAQTRALHFSKGCYLGQEIVERIRSRGNVHRTFHGFELTGGLPGSGAILSAEGKPAGELTSVASIPLPTGPVQLALGYVRREALDRSLTLEYPGGIAKPVALPYAIP